MHQVTSHAGPEKTPLPGEQAQTLLALIHARAEVARLSERERLFGTLLDSVNAVIWALDWKGQRMLYVSPAYERLFGRPAALLLNDYGQWRNSIYPDDQAHALRSMLDALDHGAAEMREYRIIRGDGQLRWISDKCFVSRATRPGQGPILVGIAEDITERKRREGRLLHLESAAALAPAGDQGRFFERARREFEHARHYATPLAFLLLAIDDLGSIAERHGQLANRQVQQQVARCGMSALRGGDLFGRIGSETFAVLLPGCPPEGATRIALRLRADIQRLSFRLREESFGVSVSLGLASLEADDMTLDDLHARADAAMRHARRIGRSRVVTG